ncbi:MAG: hypothetical protein H7Y04_06650, partial [Verrucomicrobia bacterium]|nr:hypothetical protein [Cytophagales bacterium]
MLHKFRVWLRAYFGFSYREINGFMLLALIMVLLLLVPPVFDTFVPSQNFDSSANKI